jgi:hypothetical protein
MPNSAEYMRQYYIDNKDKYKERYQRNKKNPRFVKKSRENTKKHYDENPEEKKQYAKEYRAKHQEQNKKYHKAHYEKNKEMRLAKQKTYYEKNKVRILEQRFMRKYVDVMSEY